MLTERFMQDVLEVTLDTKEKEGEDRTTAQQFGYNDLTIATQQDIAPVIRGNVGGRCEKVKWHTAMNLFIKDKRSEP